MASDALFLLLKLSLAGSAAILVVLVSRAAVRRWFGARVAYALWLAVPVALAAGILPARAIVVDAAATGQAVVSQAVASGAGQAARVTMPTGQDPSLLIMAAWAAGVVLALGVLAWRQAAFTRSLGALRREATGAFRSDAAEVGPAIIGAMWPKLVLPGDFEARFDADERDMVLAHERAHLRGLDPMINGLGALAQCLNWFNPLVHLAAHAMRIDQELACDAAVMAKFPKARRRYAEAILKTQIAPMSLPLGCYWPASGAHPLKERIAMLKRELPGRRKIAIGAALSTLACVASGCVVWVAQPARAVQASDAPGSRAQAASNADLLRGVLSGNFARAEKALKAGADANARTEDGTAALAITARKEDMRMLNLLLAHGADVNLVSRGEGTALIAAARRGHGSAVIALVEHEADANIAAPGFGTALAGAARSGELQIVKYLVAHGADVNLITPPPAPWDYFGKARTPLAWAVTADNHPVADYLRSVGATM